MEMLRAGQDLPCAGVTIAGFPSCQLSLLAGWVGDRGAEGAAGGQRMASALPGALRVGRDHPEAGAGSLSIRVVPSTIDRELQQSKLGTDYFSSCVTFPGC